MDSGAHASNYYTLGPKGKGQMQNTGPVQSRKAKADKVMQIELEERQKEARRFSLKVCFWHFKIVFKDG